MAQTRSRLLSGVYQWCENPPDEELPGGLPAQVAFRVLCSCESELLRDLDLSDSNRRVAQNPLRIPLNLDTDGPYTVPAGDFSAPAFARLSLDSTNPYQYPVEITNQNSLVSAGIDGRLAISFSGTPPQIFTSWFPAGSEELYVWYERTGEDEPTLQGTSEVGSLYDDYLEMLAGAQCRELMGKPIGSLLQMRLAKSERQWRRFVNQSGQRGRAGTSRVFTPPRWRRNYPYIDGTRFFIP